MTPGDALGRHALQVQACLRASGRTSEIFAHVVHPTYERHVRPLGEVGRAHGDAVLYHMAIDSPAEEAFLGAGDGPRGVVYHNLTPARFFAGVSRLNRDRVRQGRRRLPHLAQAADLGIALSEYSRDELVQAGFARTAVCPFVVDRRPSPRRGDARTGSITVLGVGRVAPHKRWELAVRAVAVLRQGHPTARLHIVGSFAEMEPYADALRRLAAHLNVPLDLVGHVDDASLEAAYADASVFVLPSAHEGLGLPLLEAMVRDLPVVASRHAAIPETAGGAALLCDDHPTVIGEALRRVVEQRGVHDGLVALGARRAGEYTHARLQHALDAAVAPWDVAV